MNKRYIVRAELDAEAGVWVATSDDVPGLIAESATLDALQSRLSAMIPELLTENNCLPNEREVTVELLSRHFRVALPSV